MSFIKKVFDGESDEPLHQQFQKFSKGRFKDRAVIKARKSKSGYLISTTSEFANELVRLAAEALGDAKTKVTGAIVSTEDLMGELKFKEKKQFQGVKRYLIDTEMSGNEILGLLDKFPKIFFALSFDCEGTSLKIKPKAPKSGKPGKKGEERPKPDFCRLKTSDGKAAGDFVFERRDWKDAEVTHDFLITDIIIPDELKDSDDFSRIRERARRKGRIERRSVIDGEEITSETDFEL